MIATRECFRVAIAELKPASCILPIRGHKSHPTERVLPSDADILDTVGVPSILPPWDDAISLFTRVCRTALVAREEVGPAVFVELPWFAWLVVGVHAERAQDVQQAGGT